MPVHSLLLEAVVTSARKNDDDLWTVGRFPAVRPMRRQHFGPPDTGSPDRWRGVPPRSPRGSAPPLHEPHGVIEFRQGAGDPDVDVAQHRFQTCRATGTVDIDRRQRPCRWPSAICPGRSARSRAAAPPPPRRPRVAARSCDRTSAKRCCPLCPGCPSGQGVRSMPPQNATASSMTTIFW